MEFGTLLVDPPWNYSHASGNKTLKGYCSSEYSLLTTQDLCNLPVEKLGSSESVLLMWTTWPFIADALDVIDAWEYDYVTGLTWIKSLQETDKLAYGVGYWFRGATELLLVGRRKKAFRTNFLGIGTDGLVSPRLQHSRKPKSVYEVAESFDGPRLEIFARDQHPGWYSLGNECANDGFDIRKRLGLAKDPQYDWADHYLDIPRIRQLSLVAESSEDVA